jgi:hypothetical protein
MRGEVSVPGFGCGFGSAHISVGIKYMCSIFIETLDFGVELLYVRKDIRNVARQVVG